MIRQLNLHVNVPVLNWALHDLGPEEMATAKQMANAPFVFRHIALMPDVHRATGVLVGSVLPTKGAVFPAAVGGDIGCGMSANKLRLNPSVLRPRKLKKLRADIEDIVAVGTNRHTHITDDVRNWKGWDRFAELHPAVQEQRHNALTQMGTIGKGNHFAEISVEPNPEGKPSVWVVLHSGSRGIGSLIKQVHLESAKYYTRLSGIAVPNPQFSFLEQGTEEFDAYWNDLHWAQDCAHYNRQLMMARIMELLSDRFNQGNPLEVEMAIDCHHNYIAEETHFGEQVFVTRKGAIRARVEDLAIIPGSRAGKSYVVRGKGNSQSFHSCSHGAGRRMSRKKAMARYGRRDLERQTAGVECNHNSKLIGEIPSAYKDIETVMAAQEDLTEIITVLEQKLNVKSY